MNLHDKRIIVTGAGSGIGREIALAMGRQGARQVLFGRREAKLLDVQAALNDLGADSVIQAGDVTDARSRALLLQTAERAFGGIDILINNAGIVQAGRLETIPSETIRSMLDADLLAPILLTQAALPLLRRSEAGTIVNVSSAIALVGVPFYAAYAAAKAGLARFGEALRRELSGEGIHVLTVYPGATETPMMTSNRAGEELGFGREPAAAVAEALIEGLQKDALEVIRGGETRAAMIARNRDDPAAVDLQFNAIREELEQAVASHTAL